MTVVDAPSWAADRYGITVADVSSPVGRTMAELTRIGLRRNPKRAQLLVSTVLGKHLPVDPGVAADAGRLLGVQVARCLSADAGEVLTVGFAETATSLGHLVADGLGSAYLHSTRRPDGPVPVAAGFEESHSHATDHLLRPGPAVTLFGDGPLVLVDDELSTGRTALNVIAAVHTRHPRARYVLAGLVDVRSSSAAAARAELAERLGCRIDVVSLVRGSVEVPDGTAQRVARDLAESRPPAAPAEPVVRELALPWPAPVPHGGRHGFAATDRPGFDLAVDEASRVLAGVIAQSCGDAGRVLVLGTEELMYLPLRLALALRSPTRPTAFQSTTRSPVHAIDVPGYPIRRRIDFTSRVHPGAAEQAIRHVYNVRWPGGPGEVGDAEADLIVVVDDGHAVDGPDGVAASVSRATGVPVVLARLAAA